MHSIYIHTRSSVSHTHYAVISRRNSSKEVFFSLEIYDVEVVHVLAELIVLLFPSLHSVLSQSHPALHCFCYIERKYYLWFFICHITKLECWDLGCVSLILQCCMCSLQKVYKMDACLSVCTCLLQNYCISFNWFCYVEPMLSAAGHHNVA